MAQHELIIETWRERFPAFCDLTDEQVGTAWDMATAYIADYDNFLLGGKKLQLALDLMTAHISQIRISCASGGASAGVMTSATEGSVSIGYAPPPFKNGFQAWLASSPYGMELWALISGALSGGIYVGGKPETLAFRDVGGRFGFLR